MPTSAQKSPTLLIPPHPSTAVTAALTANPNAGFGDYVQSTATRHVPTAAEASAPPAPKRTIIDPKSGAMRIVPDVSKMPGGNLFTGPSAASRHEAAYPTEDRYQVQNDSITGSDTKQEQRERVSVLQKVRWAFENDPVVESVELFKRRFCEPIKWRAKHGDQDQKKRLTDFITKEMEAGRCDWSLEDDLPTLVKSSVIDWALDGDLFFNMIQPNGADTFYMQSIRAHRVGHEAGGSTLTDGALDISKEMWDLFEIRGPKKGRPRYREVGGIVLDSRNRRQGIRVYKDKVVDSPFQLGRNKEVSKTIPWGQTLQLMDKRHTDRVREFSRWVTSIDPIMDLKQTWDYLQITLKAQAGMPFLQTNKKPANAGLPIDPKTGRPTLTRKLDPAGNNVEMPSQVIPGRIQQMPMGAELVDFVAKRPNAQFKDCVKHLLHMGAWPSEIPYPILFDASGVNGGALRLENDKAASAFGGIRRVLRTTVLDKWIRAKIRIGIETGHELLRGFEMKDLSDLCIGEWSFPTLPTADEKYRSAAVIQSWAAGHCSTDDVVGPQGKSADEVLKEKAQETRNKATEARAIQAEFPEMSFHQALDHLGMVGPNGSVPYASYAGQATNKDNGTNAAGDENDGNNSHTKAQSHQEPTAATGVTFDPNGLALLEVSERVAEMETQFEEVSGQLEMFSEFIADGESSEKARPPRKKVEPKSEG
jgi:hypothetical protein